MSEPQLTVVIPTHNNRELLHACLTSLVAGTLRPNIIVVDDGSQDGTAALVRCEFAQVRLCHLGRNVGFARACNVGLRSASAPFVALLNDDVVVAPEWAAAGTAALVRDPTLGSAASLIMQRDAPDLIDSAGDLYSLAGGSHRQGRGHPWPLPWRPQVPVFSACAAAAFYRLSALQQVGYVDETLGAFYDDVDLGFRLRLAGYDCRLVPDARCWHVRGASYGRGGWRLWYLSARNSEQVFWADMPRSLLLRAAARRLPYLLIQLAQRLWLGGGAGWLAGKAAVLADLPGLYRRRRWVQRLMAVSDGSIEAALVTQWFRLHVLSAVGRSRGVAPA